MNMYIFFQKLFQKFPQSVLLFFVRLRPKSIYGLCNGYRMEFDVGESIQRQIYLGRYEPVQSRWVKEILKPGGNFLDVGANVEYYTTLAASLVGSKGHVLAFEPSPYAYKKLVTVLKSNRITHVDAFQCAAGDKEEWLDLHLPNQAHLHSPSLVPSNKSLIPVNVQVCRLDSHPSVQSLSVINLMKVDVEVLSRMFFEVYLNICKRGMLNTLCASLTPDGLSLMGRVAMDF